MQALQALVAAEMEALAAQLRTLLQSDGCLLQEVTQHTLQAPGKQLRPMLVFLVAGACGELTPKALRGALLVTLLHQASLLHDDVVDDATHRRGRPTVNAVWNNKVAVLFGDYLLAKSLHLAAQHQDHDLLALITETAQAMSEAELLQLAQARQLTTTEEAYLSIIHKKTARLLGTCFAIGALAAKAASAQVATLRQAGEQLGMAFQLKDDLVDYGTAAMGKPLGMDLRQGHLTLPLLHALREAPTQQRQAVLHTLKHHRHDPQKQQEVMAFVRQSPGMAATQALMFQYQHKALQHLAPMAASPYQQALVDLIQHIIEPAA